MRHQAYRMAQLQHGKDPEPPLPPLPRLEEKPNIKRARVISCGLDSTRTNLVSEPPRVTQTPEPALKKARNHVLRMLRAGASARRAVHTSFRRDCPVTSLARAARNRLWAAHVGGGAAAGLMASFAGLAVCGQVLVVRGGSRFLATCTASR